MIYVSDVQHLISQWLLRADNFSQPAPYRDALKECAYDLSSLINSSLMEELDYKEILESWEADDYLSTIEAHEAMA